MLTLKCVSSSPFHSLSVLLSGEQWLPSHTTPLLPTRISMVTTGTFCPENKHIGNQYGGLYQSSMTLSFKRFQFDKSMKYVHDLHHTFQRHKQANVEHATADK